MKRETTIKKVEPVSLALFEGILGLLLGVIVSILAMVDTAGAQEALTSKLLQGLFLGLNVGVLTLILVPLVYLAAGWAIGYMHAVLFNSLSEASGGLVVSADRLDISEMQAEDVEVQSAPEEKFTGRLGSQAMTFGEKIPEPKRQTDIRRRQAVKQSSKDDQ